MSMLEQTLDEYSKKSYLEKVEIAVGSWNMAFSIISEDGDFDTTNKVMFMLGRGLISAICKCGGSVNVDEKRMVIDVMKKRICISETINDNEFCNKFFVEYNDKLIEFLKYSVKTSGNINVVTSLLMLTTCFATASGNYSQKKVQLLKEIFPIN